MCGWARVGDCNLVILRHCVRGWVILCSCGWGVVVVVVGGGGGGRGGGRGGCPSRGWSANGLPLGRGLNSILVVVVSPVNAAFHGSSRTRNVIPNFFAKFGDQGGKAFTRTFTDFCGFGDRTEQS